MSVQPVSITVPAEASDSQRCDSRSSCDAGCKPPADITKERPLKITELAHTPERCMQANGQITVQATGGSGEYVYYWSNGVISPATCGPSTISGLCEGSFTVMVVDTSAPNPKSASLSICLPNLELITLTARAHPATCGHPNGSVDITVHAPDTIDVAGVATPLFPIEVISSQRKSRDCCHVRRRPSFH